MIGKLFKYDFRITAKILFPLYAGILGIGVLSQTVSFLLDLADKNLKTNPDSVINPSFLIFFELLK